MATLSTCKWHTLVVLSTVLVFIPFLFSNIHCLLKTYSESACAKWFVSSLSHQKLISLLFSGWHPQSGTVWFCFWNVLMAVSMATHRSESGPSSGKQCALKGLLTLFLWWLFLGHNTHLACFMCGSVFAFIMWTKCLHKDSKT